MRVIISTGCEFSVSGVVSEVNELQSVNMAEQNRPPAARQAVHPFDRISPRFSMPPHNTIREEYPFHDNAVLYRHAEWLRITVSTTYQR
jgi:hypothetical protein